jgi:hypothetical protein
MMMLHDVLRDRRRTHGDFTDHAQITQDLKRLIGKQDGLSPVLAEALDMTVTKSDEF